MAILVDVITHEEPLNEYFSPISESGTRKSSSMGPFTRPLYEYEKAQQEVMAGAVAVPQSQARINQTKLEKLQHRAANATNNTDRINLTRQAGELAKTIASHEHNGTRARTQYYPGLNFC